MSWLSLVLITPFFLKSLAGPAILPPIPQATAPILDLPEGLVKKNLNPPAPTPGPELRRRDGPPFWCTPAVVPNSCPATHCICTSTQPQPWKVETMPAVGGFAGWVATLSDAVLVFDTVTTPGNACPYTKIEDAGPSIYIAPQVSGTCGPASIWKKEGADDPPPLTDLPKLPDLGPQTCSLGDRGVCMCPTDRLPRVINPGETCGSTLTAPFNCETHNIKPLATNVDPMTGVACLDTSAGWDAVNANRYHVLQPDDDSKPGAHIFKGEDEPHVRRVGGGSGDGDISPDCGFWLADNGKIENFGKYKNNPCSGYYLGVTVTVSVPCSNINNKKSCACDANTQAKPPVTAVTLDRECKKDPEKDGFWGTTTFPLTVY